MTSSIDDPIPFDEPIKLKTAKEVGKELGLRYTEIQVIAKFLGVPRLNQDYFFLPRHIEYIREIRNHFR